MAYRDDDDDVVIVEEDEDYTGELLASHEGYEAGERRGFLKGLGVAAAAVGAWGIFDVFRDNAWGDGDADSLVIDIAQATVYDADYFWEGQDYDPGWWWSDPSQAGNGDGTGPGDGNGAVNGPGNGNGAGPGAGATATETPSPTPTPAQAGTGTQTQTPTPTASPTPTPTPTSTPTPTATPSPQIKSFIQDASEIVAGRRDRYNTLTRTLFEGSNAIPDDEVDDPLLEAGDMFSFPDVDDGKYRVSEGDPGADEPEVFSADDHTYISMSPAYPVFMPGEDERVPLTVAVIDGGCYEARELERLAEEYDYLADSAEKLLKGTDDAPSMQRLAITAEVYLGQLDQDDPLYDDLEGVYQDIVETGTYLTHRAKHYKDAKKLFGHVQNNGFFESGDYVQAKDLE